MVVARGIPFTPPNPLLARVQRAQAGDAPAFTELVHEHQHAIYSLVLGIVRNTEDAGDIVQDVWVKVARHLPQLREPERFVPWLYRIARNCSMDFCNARKKRPQAAYRRDDEHDDDPFDVPDSSTYVPEQELLSLDERRKVWEALGALSEADRTALFLRESRELPYAEIARILGISCNAAEVRVFRARERFRKQFIQVEEAAPECNISPLQLGAFVDGELGDATHKMLERHIHSCEECTSRLTAIESGRTLYRGLGLFLMPSGLTAGILSNLPVLGFASAATVAAAAGTGAAASSVAATSAAVATASAATGPAATASTFGAGIAAAVAAVAMTGTVAVEYTDTSSATPALPPAATVEIALPPAAPVMIVFVEPAAPLPAEEPGVEALAQVVSRSEPAIGADDSTSDPGETASAVVQSAPAPADSAGGHGDSSEGRGSDAATPASTTAGERERDRGNTETGGGTVIVALSRDDRAERDGQRNDGGNKGDSATKSEPATSDHVIAIAVSASSGVTDGSVADNSRGNDGGGRSDDGGSRGDDQGGRGNDIGSRSNDDSGRGHDAGGRGR